MGVTVEPFGELPDGRRACLFRLQGGALTAAVSDYGAALVSLTAPDRNGARADVVLGFDDPQGYVDDTHFIGVVAGRYANRIAGGRFRLDGTRFVLPCNDGPNHLHGGPEGFGKRLWKGEPIETEDGVGVRLTRTSPGGEAGYPGSLHVTISYMLTADDRLIVGFDATTDRPTVANLTSHAYFNLAGGGDVLQHRLQLFAGRYTPVDASGIPTGEIVSIDATPFDFRDFTAIGARLAVDHPQLIIGSGYDQNFVVDGSAGALRPVARVFEPVSARLLEVQSTQPGVQFYTGNHLDRVQGRAGAVYGRHAGFCLETQTYPDAPNRPDFPSARLDPDETYSHSTEFRFSVGEPDLENRPAQGK